MTSNNFLNSVYRLL